MRGVFQKSIVVLLFSCALASLQAQTNESHGNKRREAMQLFYDNKHLEALPLLEDLAKENPKDHEVLLGLATCLISHAGALQDEAAAAKERLRARELLTKAKALGNTSALLENLLQTIPTDGVIKYSSTAMRDGEAAFARQDYAEAIKNYSKVLELDPTNYSAALFIGDSYFAQKDFTKAAEGYQHAIDLDPNTETAYRYYSDMLMLQGEMERARTKAIQAVVAEPYNPITWRGLDYWAKGNRLQLNRVHIEVPSNVSKKGDNQINIIVDTNAPKDTGSVWLAYSMSKALWQGDKFKQQFPEEKEYRHSLAEETDALTTAAKVWMETRASKKSSSSTTDPNIVTLLQLYQAKLIEPYVLLNAADAGIARDYPAYREKNRAKLEEYLSMFVAPALQTTTSPAKPAYK